MGARVQARLPDPLHGGTPSMIESFTYDRYGHLLPEVDKNSRRTAHHPGPMLSDSRLPRPRRRGIQDRDCSVSIGRPSFGPWDEPTGWRGTRPTTIPIPPIANVWL